MHSTEKYAWQGNCPINYKLLLVYLTTYPFQARWAKMD